MTLGAVDQRKGRALGHGQRFRVHDLQKAQQRDGAFVTPEIAADRGQRQQPVRGAGQQRHQRGLGDIAAIGDAPVIVVDDRLLGHGFGRRGSGGKGQQQDRHQKSAHHVSSLPCRSCSPDLS